MIIILLIHFLPFYYQRWCFQWVRDSDSALAVQFYRIHTRFLEVAVELSLHDCYLALNRLSIMRNMYFECWFNIARLRTCLFANFDSSYTSPINVTVTRAGNTWTFFFQESDFFLWSLLRKLSQGVRLMVCNLWVVDSRLVSYAPRSSLNVHNSHHLLSSFLLSRRVCFKQTFFM